MSDIIFWGQNCPFFRGNLAGLDYEVVCACDGEPTGLPPREPGDINKKTPSVQEVSGTFWMLPRCVDFDQQKVEAYSGKLGEIHYCNSVVLKVGVLESLP